MSSMRRSRRLAAQTLTVLTTAALVISTQAASPAQAEPAAPTGLLATSVPVLSWDPVPGAARYEVQVDRDSGFGSPDWTVKTTNTRTVPVKAFGGSLHWRVRAIDGDAKASDWSEADLDLGPISAPSQLTPDGEELAQPDEPPLVSWQGVPGALEYSVELDTDADFVSASTFKTSTTSLVIPTPLEAGDYWWRVTASLGGDTVSLPSDPATFTVLPLEAPVQVGPADSPDTQVEDVVLDWDPVPGAASYELRVARDADFNTIIGNVKGVLGTSYSPATTYDNAQYYWQVRAVDMAGKPTEWRTVQHSFERHWPDRPSAVYPIGEVGSATQINGVRYFQWTPVQHASHYELQVGSDPNFSPTTYDSCLTAGTTYTVGNMSFGVSHRTNERCTMQDGDVFYWRVRPMDAPFSGTGVEGIFSETQSAVWRSDYIEGRSPANGATVDIPTLTWDASSGAEKFRVQIYKGGLKVLTDITYTNSYTPIDVERLEPGTYTWDVQAFTPSNEPSVIYASSFTVSGALPDTPADPLTPLSGRITDPATLKAPTLTWEPHPDATSYQLHMGFSGTGVFWVGDSDDAIGNKVPYPAVTDTSRRTFQPGNYDWFVVAINAAGDPVGSSPVSTFRIAGFPAITGQAIALDSDTLLDGDGCDVRLDANGVTGAVCTGVPSTPVLSWDPVPGMSFYYVYVSNDANFTNLLETQVPATHNTHYAPTFANVHSTYPESQAGQSYYWHIRPCKAISVCAMDPVSSTGKATNAFRKQSPGIELLTPVADSSPAVPNVTTSEVTFDWTDYFDTSQATTWATTGEISPQAARQYRIQVDDSPTFATPLDDKKVDQSSYTAVDSLYPEGQLYWRVQAIDGDDKGLAWSETRPFVKYSPPVELTFPTNDAEVSGTAAFRWTAQPFNYSYRIEVFKNNDTTFSVANRVFYKEVKTTAFAWDKPLPASSQPYVWRVRRTDADRNLGQWSQSGRFYSTGSSPSLLEPEHGTLQPAAGPLFTWTAVPGAATYRIEIRTGTGTFAKVTTAALAYATTANVPDGKLTWQVTALDAGGAALGSSEWRSFTVDGAAPRVVSYTPTSQAKRKANVVVRFSEPVHNVSTKTLRIFLGSKKKPLAATVKLNAAGTTATLNPTALLKKKTKYTVKVRPGIVDQGGNSLPAKSWTFTTK